MARPKKLAGPERRVVAQRYKAFLANQPKRICGDFGINKDTMLKYAREFMGRI